MTETDIRHAVATAIEPYREILASFVHGDVSADAFEADYLDKYLKDDSDASFEVFKILDGFFAAVDAYVGDPVLRAGTSDGIGPDELREKAADLLRRAGYDT